MVTLTRWEVEELLQALRSRGHLWQNAATATHPIRWVRRTGSGRSRYALVLTNGLPRNCYMLDLTLLDLDQEVLIEVQHEVQSLLRKLTSYGQREAVLRYLSIRLCGWREGTGDSNLDEMSYDICKIVCNEELPPEPTIDPLPVPAPAPKRSNYLRKLLGEK